MMIIDEWAPTEAEEGIYERLAIQLSKSMGLAFETIPIKVDRKSTPYWKELLAAGLLPTKEQAKNHLSETECRELESDGRILEEVEPGRTDECIFELLGIYSPSVRSITIYEKMIRLVSARLDLDPQLLKEVVIAHETAHAVSHLGRDGKGIWFCFSCASSDEIELYAQIYPFLIFKSADDSKRLRCFLTLSDHQSDRYNSWRALRNESTEGINVRLALARSLILDCSNAVLDGNTPRPENPSACSIAIGAIRSLPDYEPFEAGVEKHRARQANVDFFLVWLSEISESLSEIEEGAIVGVAAEKRFIIMADQMHAIKRGVERLDGPKWAPNGEISNLWREYEFALRELNDISNNLSKEVNARYDEWHLSPGSE